MKKVLGIALVASLAVASPALAHSKMRHHRAHHAMKMAGGMSTMANAEVTERDAKGHATKVKVEGQEYAVCVGAVVDSCINPRQAGLNFGNTPLDHWPGKPASDGK